MQRRGFMASILAAGFAPAIARGGILMPVRQIWRPAEGVRIALGNESWGTGFDGVDQGITLSRVGTGFGTQLVRLHWRTFGAGDDGPRSTVVTIPAGEDRVSIRLSRDTAILGAELR